MKYKKDNNNIILWQEDFDLDETLDCGQAFRWKKVPSEYDCTYSGFFLNDSLTISKKDNYFIFHNTSEKDFLEKWTEYFDFNTDYGKLKEIFCHDETLKKACEFAGGIRLLKQDSWETLLSFIISQNNNIPRIKLIIDRLCSHYGHFPSADELSSETTESIDYLKSGFRAKYIIDASQRVSSGEINLDEIKKMPLDEARNELMKIKGVGKKVSECVLLFGMYRTEAFPIDVWIKRVLETYYPEGFPEYLKSCGGIAQQYLFHYIRNHASVN